MYQPPEYKDNYFNDKNTSFSLGIIFYFMLTGQLPFNDWPIDTGEDIDFSGKVWKSISPKTKDVVKGLLEFDPTQRMAFDMIQIHYEQGTNQENINSKNGS